MGRLVVRTSRLVRTIRFQSPVIRHLIDCIRSAVEELRPLEREIARVQRKLESWPGGRAENIKDLRKEQRTYNQRMQHLEHYTLGDGAVDRAALAARAPRPVEERAA